MASDSETVADHFRRFSTIAAHAMGTPLAFFVACSIVLVWALLGPFYHFSDTWQMVINTGTTIITFLMVFIVQTTQNRDARALHLKLDELIRAKQSARNAFTDLQNATDEELTKLQEEFAKIRQSAGVARSAIEEARPAGGRDDSSKAK